MAITYEPISTTTANGSVSTITFSSIPSTYTDLILAANFGASASTSLVGRFNSVSTNTYSNTRFTGSGSDKQASQTEFNIGNFSTSGIINSLICHIFNYANTSFNKTALFRLGNQPGYVYATAGLWRNNSAITSITLNTGGNQNFTSGSVFTLYGIKTA